MRTALLLIVCILPLAGAAPGDTSYPTTLYMYAGPSFDFLMTPVEPPNGHYADQRMGLAASSACIDVPLQTFTSAQQHTWYAYVVPVPPTFEDAPSLPVQYRGIGDDLRLDGDAGMQLHWYLATTSAAGAGVVAPRVVVEATVREGDDISVGHQAFNAGQLIAHERTVPADLSPYVDHPQVTHHRVGDLDVYEFTLDLDITGNATVPQEESFNVRIDAFVDNPLCDRQGAYLMPDLVEAHSSSEHRPRLQLAHFEPVRIQSLSASFEDGAVVFEGRVLATFGSGDAVLPAGGPFGVEGPGPAELTDVDWGRGPQRVQDGRVFVTAGHDPAIVARQVWDLRNASAEPGQYALDIRVATMSGANASAQVPFTIGGGGAVQTCRVEPPHQPDCTLLEQSSKRSPAPLMALVAMAVLVAAWRRR